MLEWKVVAAAHYGKCCRRQKGDGCRERKDAAVAGGLVGVRRTHLSTLRTSAKLKASNASREKRCKLCCKHAQRSEIKMYIQ